MNEGEKGFKKIEKKKKEETKKKEAERRKVNQGL